MAPSAPFLISILLASTFLFIYFLSATDYFPFSPCSTGWKFDPINSPGPFFFFPFFFFSFFFFFTFIFLFSFFFLSFYTRDPSPRPLILLPLSRPILFSLSLFLSFSLFALSLFLSFSIRFSGPSLV